MIFIRIISSFLVAIAMIPAFSGFCLVTESVCNYSEITASEGAEAKIENSGLLVEGDFKGKAVVDSKINGYLDAFKQYRRNGMNIEFSYSPSEATLKNYTIKLSVMLGDSFVYSNSFVVNDEGNFVGNLSIDPASCKITAEDAKAIDKTSVSVEFTSEENKDFTGTIEISTLMQTIVLGNSYNTPGDITNDDAVNSKDLLAMRKFVAGIDTEYKDTVMLSGDVNADYVVNTKDILLLRRSIAGVDVELF